MPLSAFSAAPYLSHFIRPLIIKVNYQQLHYHLILLPGVALGDAVNQINKTVEEMHLPADIRGSFQGTAQAFQASLAT